MLGLGNSITSSGHMPFTLSDVNDLSLWLQNGVGLSSTSGKVQTWSDSSGNNNHAVQLNADYRAEFSDGGLDFEEGDYDHYNLASSTVIDDTGGFCVAWVMDTETSTNNTLTSDSADEQIRIQNASKLIITTNNPSNLTTVLHFDSAPFGTAKALFLLNRTEGASGRFTLFKNGVSVSFDDSSGDSTLADAGENTHGFDFDTIGASNSGGGNFFDGKILEFAFWSKALTVQEIADVNSYLKDFHGL